MRERLDESQKDFEALNSQLVDELPLLLAKCARIFHLCFERYVKGVQTVHHSLFMQLSALITSQESDDVLELNTWAHRTNGACVAARNQYGDSLGDGNGPLSKFYMNLKHYFFMEKNASNYLSAH